MPMWNKETKRYDEETDIQPGVAAAAEREERFRTYLLNEMDALTHAIVNLDSGDGFRVNDGRG